MQASTARATACICHGGGDNKQQGVDAVKDAAMAGKYVAGVLDPESALHERLKRSAPCAEDAIHRATPEHLPICSFAEILGEAEGEHRRLQQGKKSRPPEKAFPMISWVRFR